MKNILIVFVISLISIINLKSDDTPIIGVRDYFYKILSENGLEFKMPDDFAEAPILCK